MPLNGFKESKSAEQKKQVSDGAKRVGYRDSAGVYHPEVYKVEIDEETGLMVLPYDPDWEE